MPRKLLTFVIAILFVSVAVAQTKVADLQTENTTNPIGLGTAHPRFGWKIVSTKRAVMQTAYEVQVSTTLAGLSKGAVWNSGKITSDQSVFVDYNGAALQSTTRYFWRVRIWDEAGKATAWSEPAFFETGFLSPADWKAKWIESGLPGDIVLGASPYFRKVFDVTKPIASARLTITAHGMYEASINGKRVGDAYLTPGWTSYKTRLQYQVYDVTASVAQGKNAIGVILGDGWYRGHLAWEDNKNFYGNKLGVLAQLTVTYSDGTSEAIVTDDQWKVRTGPIVSSSIYHGEVYNAQLEMPDWNKASFDASAWTPVTVKDFPFTNLTASESANITKHETFKPIKVITTPKGEKVIDFGQNLTGWVHFKVSGAKGTQVTIRHAEVLDKKGNFYTDNLRAAKAEVHYTLKGNGIESYEPRFTFFGFRYIQIMGYPGEITADNFEAIALYSDMKGTGQFSCSNALVNQLQHNIQWGQRGNFLDVPTDCPQRDERLGWTGDAQAFARTATFNFDVENFFAKWLKDLAADQQPDGRVPFVIPNVLKPADGGSAGWADAATIIPWTMYVAYGDKRILEDQYASMKSWIRFMQTNSTDNLWNKGFHFGDWLFYRPFDDNDGRSAVTDKYLIAQCFYAHSLDLTIKTAKLLGATDDVNQYTALLEKVKAAFMNEYVTPNGHLVSSTQTAYVLALNFDMLPEGMRKQAADFLVKNIKSYGTHLTTGFLGTPYLTHVLTRFGYTDVAYQLLLQESYPSWLYPVKLGATTIWERWDGIRTDSTFQTPGMNSFNHYAYGAIGDWLYRAAAGIDTDEEGAGYKHINIHPHMGGGFSFANAELNTHYGTVSAHWKTDNGTFTLTIDVPANTVATVYVPVLTPESITESDKALSTSKEIKVLGKADDATMLQVGSGHYTFAAKLN
ncbi:MAG: family 78 glycoside hydrolase catalytic domain [Bacteroidetes bacterium]|nr:family 78 glycoside hydrolase catalytic domain [Bacteroidota bacterium]